MTDTTLTPEVLDELEQGYAAIHNAPASAEGEFRFFEFVDAHLPALIAAARRGLEAEWRPIEAAPKDWSTVMLYWPDSGTNSDVMEGYYSCEDGGADRWMTSMGDICEPTHWQPLPKEPTNAR